MVPGTVGARTMELSAKCHGRSIDARKKAFGTFSTMTAGMVHVWVGQKLLKNYILRVF
jgi:hypothetical protein